MPQELLAKGSLISEDFHFHLLHALDSVKGSEAYAARVVAKALRDHKVEEVKADIELDPNVKASDRKSSFGLLGNDGAEAYSAGKKKKT